MVIEPKPLEDVSAINFLGAEIAKQASDRQALGRRLARGRRRSKP